MSYRVAAASTDGKVVNQHFGRAESFHIFELSEEQGYRFVESRKVDACCGSGGHEISALEAAARALSDVQAILAERIGEGASDYLEHRGFAVYEAPFPIEPLLQKILDDKLYESDGWSSASERADRRWLK